MWIKLHSKRAQTSVRKLCGQTRCLRFPLSRLSEIEERVLNAYQCKIHAHAERKRDQHPTDKTEKDFLRRTIRAMRKDRQMQQGTEAGPSHTHSQRSNHMERNVGRQARPFERKPPACGKHEG